jgi:hypothetical protein
MVLPEVRRGEGRMKESVGEEASHRTRLTVEGSGLLAKPNGS